MKKSKKEKCIEIPTRGQQITRRFTTILGGIGVLVATTYGHSITSERDYLLKNAPLQKAVVSRVSSKRTIRTLYITIDQNEFDVGRDIGRYKGAVIGDTVQVYFLPGYSYPALNTGRGFTVMLIFQYVMFVVGGGLILIGIFYPAGKN